MTTNHSEVLAIIPGKGTSSRVPGKNLRLLGGRPLLAWTIEAALGAKSLTRIVVSTENEAVAEIARGYGVEAVSHPSLDELPEVPDVCLHVLDEMETANGYRPDTVVALLPTSPFRTAQQIDDAMSRSDHVLSASFARNHGDVMFPMDWETRSGHSSGMIGLTSTVAYAKHNGAILAAPLELLEHYGFFCGQGATAFYMDPISGLDINTEQDFKYAERIAAKMLAKVPA